MKHLVHLLVLAFGILSTPIHASVPAATSFDAMVVVTIADLDDAGLERLRTEVGREKSAYMEYSCTWSGVVVIKFNAIALSERADVITMTRRLLGSAGLERGMEVVHVHVEARGVGKC